MLITKQRIEAQEKHLEICLQGEIVMTKGANGKNLVTTFGVGPCIVIVLTDPVTKTCIFSHIDTKMKCEEVMRQILSKLHELNIPFPRVTAYIAGGWQSYPSSKLQCDQLIFLLKKLNIKYNNELLCKRDCFKLDFKEFMLYVRHRLCPQRFESDVMDEYEKNIQGLFYESKSGDAFNKIIGPIIHEFCQIKYPRLKDIPHSKVFLANRFSEAAFIVSYNHPEIGFYPALVFDIDKQEFYYSNEDCNDILWSISDNDKEIAQRIEQFNKRNNTESITVIDLLKPVTQVAFFEKRQSKPKELKIPQEKLSLYKLPDDEEVSLAKGLRNAAHNNKLADLILFAKHVKDINCKDTNISSQKTALHLAVLKQAFGCIQHLLEKGALYDIEDAQGMTAYDYALKTNRLDILELFNHNVVRRSALG